MRRQYKILHEVAEEVGITPELAREIYHHYYKCVREWLTSPIPQDVRLPFVGTIYIKPTTMWLNKEREKEFEDLYYKKVEQNYKDNG